MEKNKLGNIVYIIRFNNKNNKVLGILNKIRSQIAIWSKTYEVTLLVITNSHSTFFDDFPCQVKFLYYCNIMERIFVYKLALNFLKNSDVDIVYMREGIWLPYLATLYSKYKVVVEINTASMKERLMELRTNISYVTLLSFFLGKLSQWALHRSSGFITVTDEICNLDIKKYGHKYITIPNSIDLTYYSVLKRNHLTEEVPNLFFLGTPGQTWHGIDKIIRLAQSTLGVLNFTVIGCDLKNVELPNNIRFYGYLHRDEYTRIISMCDIGIGTLALHRKGLSEACPLKVREYLAMGFPVILAYNDSAFSLLPDFILKIDNTEDNVEQYRQIIIDFCYHMKNRILTHEEVKEYISADNIEEKRVAFFSQYIC